MKDVFARLIEEFHKIEHWLRALTKLKLYHPSTHYADVSADFQEHRRRQREKTQ